MSECRWCRQIDCKHSVTGRMRTEIESLRAELAVSEGRVRALEDEVTDLRNAVNPLAYTQDRTMTEREQKRIQKALEDHDLVDRHDSEVAKWGSDE